jgi:outer membrane immunogenic protein
MNARRTILAAACIALCSSATPIMAADIIEAPPEPVLDWTGFHIGLGVGGQIMLADVDAYAFSNHYDYSGIWWWWTDYTFEASGETHADRLSDHGLFGTVEAGYDFQFGSNLVLGIVGNFDFGKDLKASSSSNVDVYASGWWWWSSVDSGGYIDAKAKMGNSWAVGARLGFLASESTLFYANGGVTQAQFGASVDFGGWYCCGDSGYASLKQDKDWLNGFFVGGGIETLFGEHWSLKGEYRYANYETLKADYYFDCGDCGSDFYEEGAGIKVDPVVHSIRAVLSYRF